MKQMWVGLNRADVGGGGVKPMWVYRPFAEGCGPPTHCHLGVQQKNGSFVLYTECTKLQASFYGRNFCWETFRPIFYKDKGLIQQFIKVCECSFMQKDR